jgi:CobB/CobQ-like glutamine amidotransferase domain
VSVTLARARAERFECRWASVEVRDSPAVMLSGMAGSVLGVWVAHGEGRCLFPDAEVERAVLDCDLAPLRYADSAGRATEAYPANPNGSPHGIAALCSADGRHLAMMPHPERCAAFAAAWRCSTCWRLSLRVADVQCDPFQRHSLRTWGKLDPHARVTDKRSHLCRCFLGWQLPWCPGDVGISKAGPGPWLKLFQNACAWAEAQ